MVGCKLYIKEKKTEWINRLLHSKFFSSCVLHQDLRKNEKNVFCLDCSIGICKHCVTAHRHHLRLQICKYIYNDVVRVHDLQKLLDCSKIQTYKINGEKAVRLNPRPNLKDTKLSAKSKSTSTCKACERCIQELPNNHYCSIACKVSVVPVKPEKGPSHEFITASIPEFGNFTWKENCSRESNTSETESSISMAESNEEIKGWVNTALKARKLLHKRKGIPHRAPFC